MQVNENILENSEGLDADDIENQSEDLKQFLTFTVDGNNYAVDIMQVMEIRGWVDTTRIPNSSDYMRGVINLRGIVIPIFDLRTRFAKGITEVDEKNVVIVVSINDRVIGILVDAVSDILTINNNDIRVSPSSAETDIEAEYVAGLISHNENMVIILEVANLFGSEFPEDLAEEASL